MAPGQSLDRRLLASQFERPIRPIPGNRSGNLSRFAGLSADACGAEVPPAVLKQRLIADFISRLIPADPGFELGIPA
jgi:hypothetical protein